MGGEHEKAQHRLLWLVVGAVVALVVPLLFEAVVGLSSSKINLVERDKARISVEVAKDARYIAIQRTLDSPGEDSWLVVIRHDSVDVPGYVHIAPVSDEVRIYDETSSGLQLAFRFQPAPEVGRPYSTGPPQGDERLPFVFQVRALPDLNADGFPEIIGAFYSVFMEPGLPRPVVINRPSESQPYRIQPLTAYTSGPRSPRGVWAVNQRRYYQWESELQDRRTKTAFQSQPVEEYALVSEDAVLITAYVKVSQCHACIPTLSMRAERLGIAEGGRIATINCLFRKGRDVRSPSASVHSFPGLASTRWRQQKAGRSLSKVCPVPRHYFAM